MSAAIKNSDLTRYLSALQRYKKKVITFVAAMLLIGVGIIFFFPRSYRSESRLFLQVGRESVGIDPTATVGQTVALQTTGRAVEMQSAVDVLTSRGLSAKIVDELGAETILDGLEEETSGGSVNPFSAVLQFAMSNSIGLVKKLDPLPLNEEAIEKIEKSLEVEVEPESAVISVAIDAETPKLAQKILSTLIDVYEQEHAKMHRNEMSQEFFDEQRGVLREQLDQALGTLQEAKTEMGIASIEERRINEEKRLRKVRVDIFTISQSLAGVRAQIDNINRQLTEIPQRMTTLQTNVPNTGADLLQDQLYQLELRKLEIESRYSATHPLVVALAKQVDEARKVYQQQQSLRQESVDDVNPLYQQLELDLKLAQSQESSFQARLAAANEQEALINEAIEKLNKDDAQLSLLERDVTLARENYQQYAEAYEQARIDNALRTQRISNLNIVQPATLSHDPVTPRKGIVAALTVLVATFGSVLLLFILERLDTTLCTSDEVESELDVTVLGSLPSFPRSPLAVR